MRLLELNVQSPDVTFAHETGIELQEIVALQLEQLNRSRPPAPPFVY
jgi:hypothetical protein